MSFVPGLGAAGPRSVSVCACKTFASPMARRCKLKRSIPKMWRNSGTQFMVAQEDIDVIYCKSTRPAIVSSNDSRGAVFTSSLTTPVGGQDGDFGGARPAASPDCMQRGEAEETGADRSKGDFLQTRVVQIGRAHV